MNSTHHISGLRYIPNFISDVQSTTLLKLIDAQNWRTDLKRRVQHYGYIYDYRAKAISKDMKLGPLPDWLKPLADELTAQKIFKAAPDQVIINEYLPGQGISAHIDCIPGFGAHIASISLGSAIDMRFDRGQNLYDLRLMPRSLLSLCGDARQYWRHGIAARKTDPVHGKRLARSRRISLTFRTVNIISS